MSLDDSMYGIGNQISDGSTVPHPGAKLRGGDVDPCHLERQEIQLLSGARVYRRKTIGVHSLPTYRNQCSQFGNPLGVLPFVELGELVSPQEEEEFCVGLGSPHQAKSVYGVGRALPFQLQLTHAEEGIPGNGSSSHFRSNEGW